MIIIACILFLLLFSCIKLAIGKRKYVGGRQTGRFLLGGSLDRFPHNSRSSSICNLHGTEQLRPKAPTERALE